MIGQCTADTQIKGCASDTNVVSTFSGDDCDTVGGLIGQWETSTAASLITDCRFGGSVSCNNINSAVAGILGANFDFRGQPGVIIRNCMVSTKILRVQNQEILLGLQLQPQFLLKTVFGLIHHLLM